jgi:Ankyrin repeats (3 copies)
VNIFLFSVQSTRCPSCYGAADQLSLARSLLGADPSLLNGRDADGRTSLHVAASSGALDVTRYLIDQMADVNAKDAMGWTPMMVAGEMLVLATMLDDPTEFSRSKLVLGMSLSYRN